MEPGEKVVAAVAFEGKLLIFGERGSVVEAWTDSSGMIAFRFSYSLPRRA